MRTTSLLLAVVLVVGLAGCVGPVLDSPSDDDSASPPGDGNAADGGDATGGGEGADGDGSVDGGSTDGGPADGTDGTNGDDGDGESDGNGGDGESDGNGADGGDGENGEDGEGGDGPADDGNATATFRAPGGNATVSLEVAATPEERRTGLMNHESLPEDHGMVFVYDEAGQRAFWMKNTTIPLDIIYVAANGTVSNVEHADPEPDTPDHELERYRSDGPARYVIELEQGFANRTGVGAGTEVVFHDDLHGEDGNGDDERETIDLRTPRRPTG